MTQIEAMKLALEALELINIEFVCGNGSHHKKEDRHEWDEDCPITNRWRKAITAIEEALAQPEQEPVANIRTWHKNGEQHAELWNWDKGIETLPDGDHDLYTTPPQRTEQCNYPDCKCPTENPCLKGLAQPEQEPVAWPCLIDSADFSENTIMLVMQCEDYKVSAGTHWLFTTPPQRKPLTEKRIEELYSFWVVDCQDIVGFARAVERTVKGEV